MNVHSARRSVVGVVVFSLEEGKEQREGYILLVLIDCLSHHFIALLPVSYGTTESGQRLEHVETDWFATLLYLAAC